MITSAMLDNRYDHRFHSHYQSNQETQGNSNREQDKAISHLSPITGKNGKGNKENINIFDQVNSLLKHYRQNPLKSTKLQKICKEKCSLPTSDNNRALLEVCHKLHSNQAAKVNSLSAYSKFAAQQSQTSQEANYGYQSPTKSNADALKYYNKYIQKPSSASQQKKRCSYHKNKKAKFFDLDGQKIATFYCSNCSINKLVNGHKIFLIEDYNRSKHRNIFSDSGMTSLQEKQVSSLSRANFWSVDENSLMSSTPLLLLESLHNVNAQSCKQQKTFESSIGDVESEDQLIKEKELQLFIHQIEMMQQQSDYLLNPVNIQSQTQRIMQVTQDLENTLRKVKKQTLKIIKNINSQSQPLCKEQTLQAQEIILDLKNIHSDIHSNRDNIINQMQIKPFRVILNKYREKMNTHEASMNRYFSTQNVIKNQLAQVNQVVSNLENLRSLMSQQLGLQLRDVIESPALEDSGAEELMSTSRNIIRKLVVKPFNGENVYISFENKELFMAAQRASMPSRDVSTLRNNQVDVDLVQHESLDLKNSERKVGRSYILESPNFLRG